MNFSQFFIQRPIFAAVLSLLVLIAGAISLFQLPISEYPEVVPPTVVVRADFPGANPKVIGETVASPLEQAIVGGRGRIKLGDAFWVVEGPELPAGTAVRVVAVNGMVLKVQEA